MEAKKAERGHVFVMVAVSQSRVILLTCKVKGESQVLLTTTLLNYHLKWFS